MKPLAEHYLGGLPSLHRQETWKDVGMRAPAGVVEKRVEKGHRAEEPGRDHLQRAVPVRSGASRRACTPRRSCSRRRLREALREDLGGTYSVTINDNSSKIPSSEYDDRHRSSGAIRTRTNDLVKRVFQEIDAVKTNGVDREAAARRARRPRSATSRRRRRPTPSCSARSRCATSTRRT